MSATRRGFLRGLVAVAAAMTVPTGSDRVRTAAAAPRPATQSSLSGTHAHAPVFHRQDATDWTDLLTGMAVSTLFAPTSGALLAATGTELLRSDDAGDSWRSVPLPERKPGSTIAVDPTNHDTIYAATEAGVQRSEDGGQSWATILPTTRTTHPFREIVVSTADPRIVFAAQYNQTDFWLYRTLDGGTTWDLIDEQHASMCGMGMFIFKPHPSDPARVFRAAGCYAGRNLSDELEQSHDGGLTFQPVAAPKFAFPHILVGGSGTDADRFYLAANKDFRSGGSLLLTSTDDGATWTTVLEHTGGGTMHGPQDPSITLTGLTYDPAAPQRVFLAQQEKTGTAQDGGTHTVIASSDGGAGWNALGSRQLARVNDLVLGIDGRNLFAATEDGVLRIALG
jgi:hypothetical protein